jgi:EpsI family protein
MQIGGWTGQDIGLYQPQEILARDYQNTNQPEPQVTLFIYDMRQIDSEQKHDLCLCGAGWALTLQDVVQIARPEGSSFSVNRYVASKAGQRELALNWYQVHGRGVASEYWAKFYLVADSIRMNRSDGALVELMTPMTSGESPDAAQARVMRLGSQLIPMLYRYISR